METIPHSVVFRMPSLSRICRGKVRQSRKAEKGCPKEVSMLFMVSSRPKAGAEQLIEHLARRLVLLRGIWPGRACYPRSYTKVGAEPGFFGVLNAPSIEEANKIIAAGVERLELFELEVVPVNQFPHFA
jgi:hypothetical protein